MNSIDWRLAGSNRFFADYNSRQLAGSNFASLVCFNLAWWSLHQVQFLPLA
jgi:hypothetical protein